VGGRRLAGRRARAAAGPATPPLELTLRTGRSGRFVALALVVGTLAAQRRRRGAGAAARRGGGTAVLMLPFALLMRVGARRPPAS
jgi:hypothetical protein